MSRYDTPGGKLRGTRGRGCGTSATTDGDAPMSDPNEPISAPLESAYANARAICRAHARSFYFASHFLPDPKRQHAYAVYAFCRLLDDAADESGSVEAVERFERALDDVYGGRNLNGSAPHPALNAFAHTVRVCRIPRERFEELAVGCRMDFTVTRYATWNELENYCYHVAGVVGLIMCDVFGLRHQAAREQAIAMGNAMQLTNILRDVREDLDRGRLYLPQEDLAQFGVTEADLRAGRVTRPVAALMRFEIARARSLYAQGAGGLPHLPNDGSRFTASVMSVVYAGILDAIEEQNYDVFRKRAALSTWEKLCRVPAALRVARREVGDLSPAGCA